MHEVELAFERLSRSFGRVAVLAGVSGDVGPGEVMMVCGPNGSGKSTLLRCLAGLLRPQSGSIRLREGGRELDAAARRLRGVPRGRAGELLGRLDLPPERPAGALSSGMRQKLRWAWALLHEPRVLLLDEPFQNLDAAGEAAVREQLDRHLEQGLAVVATPAELRLPRLDHRIELTGRGAAAGRAA